MTSSLLRKICGQDIRVRKRSRQTRKNQDIRQATAIAKAMVMEYGMSEKVGLVNYGSEGDEIFIGRDFGQTKSYGEHMATIIDEEVKRIIDSCYREAKDILIRYRGVLERGTALLLEKEKIGQAEFEALFEEEPETIHEN